MPHELLKQIAEQQSVLAAAQTNVNNNFASLLVESGGTSAEFEAAGVVLPCWRLSPQDL